MSRKEDSVQQDSKPHRYEGFWGKSCLVLGIIHVLIGVSSMVVNGIGIYFHANKHNYAQGMWSGVIFLISGFSGVVAGHIQTPIPVKVTMVLSIISAVFSIPMLGITAAGLDHDRRVDFNYWIKDPYTGIDHLDGKNDTRKAAHALLLTLSLLELCLAVLSTLICAHGVFHCDTYKGANQSPGQAMLFPKSASPVSHEVPIVEAGEKPKNADVYNIQVPDMYPRITSQPPGSANTGQYKNTNSEPNVEYKQSDKKQAASLYPSQPSWKPVNECKVTERGPPVIGATGSSAFQPLHSVPPGPKLHSYTGSHNTSTSSFTPLHMIQPDHHNSGYSRHNMSTSSSEMYPPPKRTSSRSSTPAYGGQEHYGSAYGGTRCHPSSRSSKSSHHDQSTGYQSGGYQYGSKQQRRI